MNPLRISICFLCALFVSGSASLTAQENLLARITVYAGENTRIGTPVSVSLKGITPKEGAGLKLQEVNKGQHIDVPVQIEKDHSHILWWEMSGTTKPGDKRVYELRQQDIEITSTAVQAIKGEASLKIFLADKEILQYNHAVEAAPDNPDLQWRTEEKELYDRGAFIHPLRTPSGTTLTRIHSPDHIHHMGFWSAWTKTRFEDRDIDFWNIGKGEGTVRFANYSSIISGNIFGGFEAIQNHVDLKAPNGEKVALIEEWDVRVWNSQSATEKEGYLMDFTSILNPASNSPVTIEEYRYAGFGFRALEHWHKGNSGVLTSEGKSRLNGDGTKARWSNVFGETANGKAGILFMSHPKNYNHPEPMRIWPENSNNNRGDVFFQFAPTRDKDWELKPGNDYVLKYRMYIYDGTITAEEAERLWQDFGNPPIVEIEKL